MAFLFSTGSLLFRNALRATVQAARAVRDGEPASNEPSYDNVQDLVARALNGAWNVPASSDD